MNKFGSLRMRLLLPLLTGLILSGVLVAAISLTVADREVDRQTRESFQVIRKTLEIPQFPLTPAVLHTLSDLTGTELVTYDATGFPQNNTSPVAVATLPRGEADRFTQDTIPGFFGRSFTRKGESTDGVSTVLVLYDASKLRRARRSAAILPAATGLTSALLVGMIALVVSQQLIKRISLLKANVDRVAKGDFAPGPLVGGSDELGELGSAVRGMSLELRTLWQTIRQQERQKLMHQLAAGLAHQLRNSLTGASMALDLHAGHLADSPLDRNKVDRTLDVARREIRRTQEHVSRILRLTTHSHEPRRSNQIESSLESTRESLEIIAKHHRVALSWDLPAQIGALWIRDGASLAIAVENLTLNAIEAGGDSVRLSAQRDGHRAMLTVSDNGPGFGPDFTESVGAKLSPNDGALDATIEESTTALEPFVTSKPEGLGLGLTLVQRSALRLGGDLSIDRRDGWTVFELSFPASEDALPDESQPS